MRTKQPGDRTILENTLIKVVRDKEGNCTAVGKRVGKGCTMTAAERRAYVDSTGSPVAAVKTILDGRRCSLGEALTIFNQARGGSSLDPNSVQRRYEAARCDARFAAEQS